jgi:PAS domain S-box-containing protein
MPGGNAKSTGRAIRLWWATFAVFSSVTIAVTALFIWNEREAALTQNGIRLQGIAAALAEQATQSIAVATFIAEAIANRFGSQDLADDTVRHALHLYLKELVDRSTLLDSAWLVDANGNSLAGDRSHPVAAGSAASRAYFRADVEGHQGIYIHRLFTGAVSGKPLFSISMAVRDEAGQLLAVIALGISTDHFRDLFAGVTTEPGKRATVRLVNGDPLVQIPEDWTGQPETRDNIRHILQSQPRGTIRTQVEDEARLVSWHLSGNGQVYATIGMPVGSAFSFLSAPVIGASGGALVSIALFGLLAATATRRERTIRAIVAERSAIAADRLEEIDSLYREAPVGLALFDRDARFLRINPALAEMNGLPREAHIGRRVREILPGVADAAEKMFEEVFRTGQGLRGWELHGSTPKEPGERAWAEDLYPVRDGTGAVRAVGAVVREVTDDIRAVEALRLSERRAKTLLDEVHHRTKNNLQLLSSMVGLMQRRTADAATREQLEALIDRILALAQVHDILHIAEATDEVQVHLLLGGLLDHLAQSVAGDCTINYDLPAQAVVSTDMALALALAANELVTNSCKHGARTVTVACAVMDGRLSLAVQDDGDGFPAGFDPAQVRGFGLRMVMGMAAQHGGAVAFGRTSVTLTLPTDGRRRPH